MLVDGKTAGKMLHVLEYHPDIHIIQRIQTAAGSMEKWMLRSDQFPPTWDGKHVTGQINTTQNTIALYILRAKKKGATLTWQPHPKPKKR